MIRDSRRCLSTNTIFWGWFIVPILLFAAASAGQTVLYEDTFDADPTWLTDDPTSFYWDAANRAYYARTINGRPEHAPNRYAIVDLPVDITRAFTLQWDQMLLSAGPGSRSAFGLMSDDLLVDKVTYYALPNLVPDSTVNLWMGAWGRPIPAGDSYGLNAINTRGEDAGFGSYSRGRLALSTWYRNRLSYDASTRSIIYSIIERDSGHVVVAGRRAFTGPDGFSATMTKLGVGNDPSGYHPRVISTANPTQFAEALIDNVRLVQIDAPQQATRTEYTALPVQSNATGLILIAHGTDSSPANWPSDLATRIQNRLTDRGMTGEWDVVAYDWSELADTGGAGIDIPGPLNLEHVRQRAIGNGLGLGSMIEAYGYANVHLIGHSNGVWLVDSAAQRIKALAPTVSVQTTFLDAYTPFGIGDSSLGASANWADQYFTEGDLPFTDTHLDNAFNVEITDLDPEPNANVINRHGWAHEWYRQTVDPFDAIGQGWGFQRSLAESGPDGPDIPVSGYLQLGVESSVARVGQSAISEHTVDFNQSTVFTSDTGEIVIDGFTQALTTGSPVWTATLVDLDVSMNVLLFDVTFTSSAGAEGLLGVYLDGVLLTTIDERYALIGQQTYSVVLGNGTADGQHLLAFRLDPYSITPSSALVENVTFAAIPEPSAAIMILFGGMLLARRPQASSPVSV